MVRPVVEIHLVADVQTQADRSEMPFKSATGIESPHHVFSPQIQRQSSRTFESYWGIVQAEIDKSALSGKKWLNGVAARG